MKNIIIILMLLIMIACGNNDFTHISEYQDAIYIMSADGSNKQKVIDVDGCSNVQFIPNSNKILFMTSRNDGSFMKQIHTVNIDGTDSLQISGEFLLKDEQPAVSIDGSKIVFWALPDSRDYSYDLYLTDPLGTDIVNLTDTEWQSEKDASFIEYEGQEYLLYVTYYRENSTNYSTISLMDTETFSVDTLYVEEIDDEWGFKHPVYHSDMDLLFVAFGQYNDYIKSNLMKYNGLYDSESTKIYEGIYSLYMMINNQSDKLIFKTSDLTVYDINLNQLYTLPYGFTYDTFDDILIYCTDNAIDYGYIYSINLDGTNNTLLAEDGYYPRYTQDGSQIVYIGRYIINPRRNLITN